MITVTRGFARWHKAHITFLQGKAPDPKSLLGPNGEKAEWRVDMLTGPIPNMGGKWFRHRKVFELVGDEVRGCNILFSNFKWGRFVVKTHDVEGIDCCIDYNVPENTFTRGIEDFVRTTEDPNVLIGEFYFKGVRRAYFTLTRIR